MLMSLFAYVLTCIRVYFLRVYAFRVCMFFVYILVCLSPSCTVHSRFSTVLPVLNQCDGALGLGLEGRAGHWVVGRPGFGCS